MNKKVRQFISNIFKKQAVRVALAKLLGSAALGGVRAWLITFVVEHLYEYVAEPIIKKGLRQANYIYNRIDGKVHVKKIHDAADQTEYDDSIDDAIS